MTTWACDKFAFPIQVATLAFSSSDVISESLHIFTHDAFTLKIYKEIQFIDPSNGNLRKYKVSKFSSIISNFPFVQFEEIAQLNPEVKTKINDFYKKYNVDKDMQLDGRCDIYAYIPFLLFDLLTDSGYIGFIVSNSWISTKSGKAFRKVLLKFYCIDYIITSGNDRWFKNTKVVTNLVVFKKRNKENSDEITSSVTTKISLNLNTNIDEIATDIITANEQSHNITISQYDRNMILQIDEL
jgi:predicted helicase